MRRRNRSNLFYYLAAAVLLVGLAGVVLWQYYPSAFRVILNLIQDPAGRGRVSGGADSDFRQNDASNQTYEPAEGSEDNFTFQFPEKFNVTEIPLEDGMGKKLLVESSEPQKGFELTIIPFDEPGPLTSGRILQDLPDAVIQNEKNLTVGGDIPALAFNSTDENIGPTYEIWFSSNGYLYQALTYPEFGPEMGEILKTWKFK